MRVVITDGPHSSSRRRTRYPAGGSGGTADEASESSEAWHDLAGADVRPSTADSDETVELRGRIARSVSRAPIIAGSVTVAGLTQVTCEHVEGDTVALGFANHPAGNGQIIFQGPPLDLLALLVRAIGVVKRKGTDLGLRGLADIGFEQIDGVDIDQG